MKNSEKTTSMLLAYDRIIAKILNEKLPPGTPLREDHLAEEFGLSTTPIREAFRRLEYEGWLQSAPFKGSFIRKFTGSDMAELFQLREALEGMAAAEAARSWNDETLEVIRRTLTAERIYIDKAESAARPTLHQDLDFHAAVADASGSTLLKERLALLKAQISLAFMLESSQTVSPADLERTFEEHRMIFNAVERRWDDLAASLMRRHISDAGKRLCCSR